MGSVLHCIFGVSVSILSEHDLREAMQRTQTYLLRQRKRDETGARFKSTEHNKGARVNKRLKLVHYLESERGRY